ncbi:MAG TPA: hypothetical protein VHO70_19480 [Chitinispirillaceae bacterium]|nr:hypothetical protein [Chitinispirillaceae bacterium]
MPKSSEVRANNSDRAAKNCDVRNILQLTLMPKSSEVTANSSDREAKSSDVRAT